MTHAWLAKLTFESFEESDIYKLCRSLKHSLLKYGKLVQFQSSVESLLNASINAISAPYMIFM